MSKLFNILSIVILSVLMINVDVCAQVTKDVLDQNADQSQGNYAATNLNYLGSGSLGMTQSAWKNPLQHMGEGQTRPGYTKYYWTPELVLPIRLREGMYTLINFPSWEVIEQVYLGDSQSFNAEPYGPSSLMVYPEASQFLGVDTNMIVFGRSGNKYVFYVQSEAFNTDRITNTIIDIEVVKQKNAKNKTYATGPDSSSLNTNGNDSSVMSTYTRNQQREDWIQNIPIDPTKFRFDIEVYVPNPDDIIIAPERVWRDNIFTYIDLGEKALTAVQRPIVTLIVERSETPVGFRSAGPNNRLIIVEAMGDMVLRSGKRIVCLKLRRADSDGLENAIYADSNEWDLQTAHASKPVAEEGGEREGADIVDDVYNDASSTSNQDFFADSLFIDDDLILQKNINENEKTGVQNNTDTDIVPNINNIPKVKTIVSPTSENLIGEYDVRVDNSEIVVPQYSDSKRINADNILSNANANNTLSNKENGVSLPNNLESQNNSNPIFISGIDNKNNQKNLISAETEALINEFKSGNFSNKNKDTNISIELGTDENVNSLEKLWSDVSRNHSAILGKYQPFYSVDTPADGQGKEVFHLRVGPVKSLDEGDDICSQLGRNGIFCSVVRIQ